MASLASQLFLHLALLLLFATFFCLDYSFFRPKFTYCCQVFLFHVCKFLLFCFYFANL